MVKYYYSGKNDTTLDAVEIALNEVKNDIVTVSALVADKISASSTDTLTNKTINGSNNTITNIGNSSISNGIDASKIGDGTVDNTEYQHLNGVSSNLQTQLNNKFNTTATSNLNMNNNKISSLAIGTVGTDAINLNQLLTGSLTINNKTLDFCTLTANNTHANNSIPISAVTNLQSNIDAKSNLSGGNTFSGNQTFNNDVLISGNLSITGTQTQINTTNLNVNDSMVSIARNNTASDLLDIGQYGQYNSSGIKYCGVFRDASNSGRWTFFNGLEQEPTTTVNTSGTGYTRADIECGNIYMPTQGAFFENGIARFRLNGSIIQPLNGGRFDSGGSRLSSVGASTTGSDAINRDELLSGTFTLTNKTYNNPTFSGTGSALNIGSNRLTCGTVMCQDIRTKASSITFSLSNEAETVLTTVLGASGAGLDCFNYQIKNLATPTSANDATTKAYVDNINNSNSRVINSWNSNGVINSVDSSQKVIRIDNVGSSVYAILTKINSSGLTNYHELKLINNTDVTIWVGKRSWNDSGDIACMPNTKITGRGCLNLVFYNNLWIVENQNENAFQNQFFMNPWPYDNDEFLRVYMPPNSGNRTFLWGINFNSNENDIMGHTNWFNVSGFTDNSNFVCTFHGTTNSISNSTDAYLPPTDTQSYKLVNDFVYSNTYWTIQCKGLQDGAWYELVFYNAQWGSKSSDDRSGYIQHYNYYLSPVVEVTKNVSQQTYGKTTARGVGTVWSYVWKHQTHIYDDYFAINNENGIHLYNAVLFTHGTNLQ